jgi:hypothetical protein
MTASGHATHSRVPPEQVINLDRDMTGRDIAEIPERLIFCGDSRLLRMDADVRNYLLDALRRKI